MGYGNARKTVLCCRVCKYLICCTCCAKIFGAILCCLFVAPLIIFAVVGVMTWNEVTFVCRQKHYDIAARYTKEVGCQAATQGNGELVMFACEPCHLDPDTMEPAEGIALTGEFSHVRYKGHGLDVKCEMYQCVEKVREYTAFQANGGKVTSKTYTYTMMWVDHHVDSEQFARPSSQEYADGCGTWAKNPPWTGGCPENGKYYADSIQVGGGFRLSGEALRNVPMRQPLNIQPPTGWTAEMRMGTSHYRSNKFRIGLVGKGKTCTKKGTKKTTKKTTTKKTATNKDTKKSSRRRTAKDSRRRNARRRVEPSRRRAEQLKKQEVTPVRRRPGNCLCPSPSPGRGRRLKKTYTKKSQGGKTHCYFKEKTKTYTKKTTQKTGRKCTPRKPTTKKKTSVPRRQPSRGATTTRMSTSMARTTTTLPTTRTTPAPTPPPTPAPTPPPPPPPPGATTTPRATTTPAATTTTRGQFVNPVVRPQPTRVPLPPDGIGDARVTILGGPETDRRVTPPPALVTNNSGPLLTYRDPKPEHPSCTVLGLNAGGRIEVYKTEDVGCDVRLAGFRFGVWTKESYFVSLDYGSDMVTWGVRLACFCCCWLAVCLVVGPMGGVGAVFPYLGPLFCGIIDAVACCISFAPAVFLFLGLSGCIYVFYWQVQGALLLCCLLVFCGCLVGMYVAGSRTEVAFHDDDCYCDGEYAKE